MDNYDNIAHDLKQTIDEYRQNLEYLKDRFADIGNIITELDQLKLQAQHSELKGQDLFEKLSGLELKHADLSKQMAVLSADYDIALTNLKNQHNEWIRAIDSIVRDVSASITDLRTDYNDRLNKAVAEISLQAKQEAASIEQYLQQFSKEQVAEIERIKQEIVSNLIQSLGDSSTKLMNLNRELHNTSEDHREKVKSSLIEKVEEHASLLEQKVAEISLQAKQEAASIEQYLRQFSKEQVAEIERIKQEIVSHFIQSLGDSSTHLIDFNRELHNRSEDHREKVKSILIEKVEEHASLLEQKIESVEVLSAQRIEDLRNAVMLDIKTTRKTSIAGFIIILAFIIGLIVFLIVSL